MSCLRWIVFKLYCLLALLFVPVLDVTAAPQHQRVDVDGSAIALVRAGAGSPAVVLQSGLGDGWRAWKSIIGPLSRISTVIAFDRSGYGASGRLVSAADPCSRAREQHAMLRAAGVNPPYVLVGHSIGGLYQFAFARLFPRDVAGVVLLDPTHPAHWHHLQERAPSSARLVRIARRVAFSSAMRQEFDQQAACADLDLTTPGPVAVPVRILTRTRFSAIEGEAFEGLTEDLARDWMRLTGAMQIEPVPDAGHYLQRDRPEAVIAAIGEVIAELRSDPPGVP